MNPVFLCDECTAGLQTLVRSGLKMTIAADWYQSAHAGIGLSFAAEVFHFGTQLRDLQAELYLLEPGNYKLTVMAVGINDTTLLHKSTVRVNSPRAQIALDLPLHRLCRVSLTPQ